MPLGRRIAEWNKKGLNRVTRHVAPWMPGFGLVEHRGRKSGNVYRTPINVFRRDGGYVACLTYGASRRLGPQCACRGRVLADHATPDHATEQSAAGA